MMAIPDKNETIYQVIYTSITEMSNIKILKEFGFYNYVIFPGDKDACKLIYFLLLLYLIYSSYNGFLSNRFQKNIRKWWKRIY